MLKKIIVAGHGKWCEESLKLLKKKYNISIVIGRYKIEDISLKNFCIRNNIKYLRYKNINNNKNIKEILSYSPDLIISISYDQIFKKIFLKQFSTIINFHAGNLPSYRGRSVVNWAIINGERFLGLTVHKIDSKIDTGDIILKKMINISKNDNYNSLLNKIYDKTPKLIIDSINMLKKNKKFIKQSTTKIKPSFFPLRKEGDEIINEPLDINYAYNFIRGLSYPGPYARVAYKKKIIYIINASNKFYFKINGLKIFFGNLIFQKGAKFFLKCKKGYLKINIFVNEK